MHIFLVACAGDNLVYASACMLDSSDNYRPIAGHIYICSTVSHCLMLLCLTLFYSYVWDLKFVSLNIHYSDSYSLPVHTYT